MKNFLSWPLEIARTVYTKIVDKVFGKRCKCVNIESIKKRTMNLVDKKVFLGLSSGHDSGLIAAELNHLKIPFSTYSVFYGEVQKVLNERIKILKKNKINKLKTLKINKNTKNSIQKFLMQNSPFVNINVDDSVHYGNQILFHPHLG